MENHNYCGLFASSGSVARSGSFLFASGVRFQVTELMATELVEEATGRAFHSLEHKPGHDAFVARVQAGGVGKWISDRVQDLRVAGASALNRLARLPTNITTAAITMAPESFIHVAFSGTKMSRTVC